MNCLLDKSKLIYRYVYVVVMSSFQIVLNGESTNCFDRRNIPYLTTN